LKQTQELKFGSFEIRLRVSADLSNVKDELKGLAVLNDQQIQLFLVLGRKRGHITYKGEEVTEENLSKLKIVGLLSEVRREEDGDLFWRVSEKGHILHDLIYRQVVAAIGRRSSQ